MLIIISFKPFNISHKGTLLLLFFFFFFLPQAYIWAPLNHPREFSQPTAPSSPGKSSRDNAIACGSASSHESGQYCNLGLPRVVSTSAFFQSKVREQRRPPDLPPQQTHISHCGSRPCVAFLGGDKWSICWCLLASPANSHNPLGKILYETPPPTPHPPSLTTTTTTCLNLSNCSSKFHYLLLSVDWGFWQIWTARETGSDWKAPMH